MVDMKVLADLLLRNINTSDIDNSFDGLKIVQFSDLHYLRVVNKDMVKKIVNEINLINPDIVIFTGDLIDKDFNPTDSEENDLITLLSSINSKYGKYAIIGNHDYVKIYINKVILYYYKIVMILYMVKIMINYL